jgi:hypothetical protein
MEDSSSTRVPVPAEDTVEVRVRLPRLTNAISRVGSAVLWILSLSPWISLLSVIYSSIVTGLKFDNKTVNTIGIVLQVAVAVYTLIDQRRTR